MTGSSLSKDDTYINDSTHDLLSSKMQKLTTIAREREDAGQFGNEVLYQQQVRARPQGPCTTSMKLLYSN